MSFLGANPAGFSHPSSRPVESANKGLSTRNYGGELRPSYDGHASRIELRLRRTSAASVQMTTLLWDVSAVMYPSFARSQLRGPSRRPAALGLLLRILRPFGVSVPPKTSLRTTAKNAAQTSFGPLPESRPSALGSRAHSLSSAQCDPSNNGRIQQTETLSCTRTK
jgi:hypothetical protein